MIDDDIGFGYVCCAIVWRMRKTLADTADATRNEEILATLVHDGPNGAEDETRTCPSSDARVTHINAIGTYCNRLNAFTVSDYRVPSESLLNTHIRAGSR